MTKSIFDALTKTLKLKMTPCAHYSCKTKVVADNLKKFCSVMSIVGNTIYAMKGYDVANDKSFDFVLKKSLIYIEIRKNSVVQIVWMSQKEMATVETSLMRERVVILHLLTP